MTPPPLLKFAFFSFALLLTFSYAGNIPQETINPSSYIGTFIAPPYAPLRQFSSVCPDRSTTCPSSQLCCHGFCCATFLPFCAIPSSDLCLDSSGKTLCTSHVSGGSVLGTPCLSAPGHLCCARPGFDRCSAAPPFFCVSSTGFVSCGSEEKPGVMCPDQNKCCRNPLKCCGENQCCTEGDGKPIQVEPLFHKTPAMTPMRNVSAEGEQASSGNNQSPGEEQTTSADPTNSDPSPELSPSQSGLSKSSPTTSESLFEYQSLAPSEFPTASTLQGQDSSDSLLPSSSDFPRPSSSESTSPSSEFPTASDVANSSQDSKMTDAGRACFPRNSTVELSDGRVRTMHQLRQGDKVKVGPGKFSEVFMWTHRDDIFAGDWYVKLVLEDGGEFTATVGHFVYACRDRKLQCRSDIIPVETIQVGDRVRHVYGKKEQDFLVVSVTRTSSKGLYNPQTLHGDIVVDGVVATCYTNVLPIRMAHSALAPHRALSRILQLAQRHLRDIVMRNGAIIGGGS